MRTLPTLSAAAALLLALAPAASARHFWLTFSDQTAAAGINHVHVLGNLSGLGQNAATQQVTLGGGGCADFDRDGLQDLFLLGGGGGMDHLYWNQGGSFVQATNWLVDAQGVPVTVPANQVEGGVACGDFDKDGWIDMYVTNLGVQGNLQIGQHHLYRNNGNGTFTDVAVAAGVSTSSVISPVGTQPVFGDYDLDGDLDLWVGSWRLRPIIPFGNRLFRNEGNGTFTDVTTQAGVLSSRIANFTPKFVDMDGDRYPELLIASDLCFSRYLKNNTDGTFSEITAQAGVGQECSGMGAAVADWNYDGLPDWLVTQVYSDPVNDPSYNPLWSGNKLYTNQGNNLFIEEGVQKKVVDGGWGWGAVPCDFNHDELIDILEVNGMDMWPPYVGEQAYLYLQLANGNFRESAYNAGIDVASDGRGIILFDCDNDVDMDVVITNQDEPTLFFRNDLNDPGAHAIRIFLDTSTRPSLAPDGYGSKVTIQTATKTSTHWLGGNNNTAFAQGELSVHMGLGANTSCNVTVEWQDGTTTVMNGVVADQTITIQP